MRKRHYLINFIFIICILCYSAIFTCGSIQASETQPDVEIQLENSNKTNNLNFSVAVTVHFYNMTYYNDQVYLSYHIYNEDGEMLIGENERVKLTPDSSGYQKIELQISLEDAIELSEDNTVYLTFDIVDEKNVFWFSTNTQVCFETATIFYKGSLSQKLLNEINCGKSIFIFNVLFFFVFIAAVFIVYKKRRLSKS